MFSNVGPFSAHSSSSKIRGHANTLAVTDVSALIQTHIRPT